MSVRGVLEQIVDGGQRAQTEDLAVKILLGCAKDWTNHEFDGVLDGFWQREQSKLSNAALGDGKILEQLIKLLEIIMPILLKLLELG